MEALASSAILPKFPELYSSPALIRTPIKRSGFLRISEGPNFVRLRALSHDLSGEGDEARPSGNGFGFVSEEDVSLIQGDLNLTQSNEKGANEPLNVDVPLIAPYGGGSGTRAGLFRTPISGGVQSATSAHGLPRPALAVRNLMEQIFSFVHGNVSDAPPPTRISIWFFSRFCG